jgi:outer membrane lipoprotein-sorting protein
VPRSKLPLLTLAAAGPILGQIGLEEVLARMAEKEQSRAAKLLDYSCVRRYSLENKRFHTTAEMTVRMTWRQPGEKSFEVLSEKGSGPVRKRVLRKMLDAELEAAARESGSDTRINPVNYTFTLAGSAVDERGRSCYLLDMVPKTPNRFLIRGRIWVDAEEFAIVRIEGSPAQNPSFWVRKTTFVHRYEKFGDQWLPVSNQSATEALMFGHTDVTIEYSGYRLNESSASANGGSTP